MPVAFDAAGSVLAPRDDLRDELLGVVAHAQQLAAELAVLSVQPMPGKERRGMPAEPEFTREERGVERTELHHFSRFSPQLVDASMQLRMLAGLVNGADPTRGAQGGGWLLSDRPWIEELPANVLSQVLLEAKAKGHPGKWVQCYSKRDDLLLLAIHGILVQARHREREPICGLLSARPHLSSGDRKSVV